MSFDDYVRGSVILYPFVWSREAAKGETEGRKTRETVITARFRAEGSEMIALIPVTASLPQGDAVYELPEIEVRRLARGGKARLWVVLDEVNTDILGESWYLEPGAKVGQLSESVMRELWRRFSDNLPKALVTRRRG